MDNGFYRKVFYYLCGMDYPYVDIHTHRRTGTGIELVSAIAGEDALPVRPCSVGIHPWQVGRDGTIADGKMTLDAALRLVENAEVDAIGEIGLDYSRPVPRAFQTEVFSAQLAVARERGLPVIIHCVRAFEPAVKLLVMHGMTSRSVFHGFVGSQQQAMNAAAKGCYISFGWRSFASSRTVIAMLSVPLSRFFLETDDSGTPIAEVYDEAVRLMPGTDAEGLREITYRNYTDLFGE